MRNILLPFLLPSFIFSQEVLTDLSSNPVLLDVKWESSLSKSTIVLPFIDDFSYNSSVVDPDLWQQSSVFVNRTYPINPPTIGVATFDGLDEYGLARDIISQSNLSEPSDTLLSQEINLAGLNSVYFMFYLQGKGIGNEPETGDSLVLEFLNNSLVWEQIWSSHVTNTTMQEFEKVVEVIDEQRFLHNSFQFRFRNYATISGNFDHWHIDYIKLDELLSSVDTTELDDISFVYNSPSFLSRYSEMPWQHFLNNEESELKDSIDILIRNNDASINVDYQYNVFEGNNLLETFPNTGAGWRNYSIQDFNLIGNFSHNPTLTINNLIFNSFQIDSATFIIQNIIKTSNSDNKNNDTLYHTQDFYSYFAYDDGTAESAYGININGAKLAYEFKLNRPDTIRAVQMYFPQMLDTVNDIDFNLTIWNKINGLPGDTLYSQTVSPVHTENGMYHTYYIERPFQLVGTFYVGWEQTTNDLLNIGLDKNNEANQYMYYNSGAGWAMSSYLGSWMIRPVVSTEQIVSVVVDMNPSFRVYPNPTSETIIIHSEIDKNHISIYNIQGVLVKEMYTLDCITRINIIDLSPGVYFINVSNTRDRQYQKFIIK
ncbi:T9SS type A sorting domain-containing protein [Flavobacteriales bacterium]|nr:T9SS type A sorting domain-containing protein [Flavobacteriales bacterium]